MHLPPKKVPNFVKMYKTGFVEATRKWLNKKKKTITYIPFSSFLGTGTKYNHDMFPEGKCIACVENDGNENGHAVLMVDGKPSWTVCPSSTRQPVTAIVNVAVAPALIDGTS